MAFVSMGLFRLPLLINKNISFFKLMGCGKNGTFDKTPDTRQWAILAVYKNEPNRIKPHGNFILRWLKLFKCEIFTVWLNPLEGHGKWDGKDAFGKFLSRSDYDGTIAVLTRATIRLRKLNHFWQHVAPVAKLMTSSPGFVMSVGIGEVPWVKQATFSVWKNKESMKAFAYKMREHTDVIKKTHAEKWYSEDMYVRFQILAVDGTLKGINPLAGKL